MQVVTRATDIASSLDPTRKVCFVPTMGALHQGHASLIEAAATRGQVVVSVFVNPTQFGPKDDFAKYPRNLDLDVQIAKDAGASVVFAPSVEEMYPRRSTTIQVPEVTEAFEGALRPGHFEGVATVVQKLFGMVQPDFAFFGLKDLQQCAVLARMVSDLWLPVELVFCPTFREPDGLAMSSRNAYLSEKQRATAPLIYQVLSETRGMLEAAEPIEAVLATGIRRLDSAGFDTQYLELVDFCTMKATRSIVETSVLAAACELGTTRLIDNLPLFEPFLAIS